VLIAADDGNLTIGQMVEILRGRGLFMIVILLCLPFLSPVSVPGISIPFGLAIAFSGLRIAFGREPWVPDWVLRRSLPPRVLEKIVKVGIRLHERLERIIRARLIFVLRGAGKVVAGAAIAVAGVFLSLPIPPPFPLTNTIPSLAIILICLGLMERDGWLIIWGYVLISIGTLYLASIAFLGGAGVAQLWNWLGW
jgi:hypothetical protein